MLGACAGYAALPYSSLKSSYVSISGTTGVAGSSHATVGTSVASSREATEFAREDALSGVTHMLSEQDLGA